MKKKTELKLIILVLGMIFTISIISNFNFSYEKAQKDSDYGMDTQYEIILKSPKKSGAYKESFIHIDGNWSDAIGKDWFSGDGSLGNPYVIENVTIDATSSPTGSGIFVNNSKNKYFFIRNCTVYNASSGGYNAGIKLENTSNGTLINNKCSNNGQIGILLKDTCNNNTVLGNFANNGVATSQSIGIRIDNDCDNNKILGNMMNNNTFNGMLIIGYCDNNIISGNIAINEGSSNQINGMRIRDNCFNNIISGNILKDNNLRGIYLHDDCHYNNISGNSINDNGKYGIHFDNTCNYNNISRNSVNDNGEEGIYFDDFCDYNNISGNSVNDNGIWGIDFDNNCDYNNISGNSVNDNGNGGIRLLTLCRYNRISRNVICNNMSTKQDYGIYIDDTSNYNNITENMIYNNVNRGIWLKAVCVDNLVHSNYFIENGANARDEGNNQWDNGVVGNYWDNYSGQDILPIDGIGDTPHPLLINKFDNKPMMYNYKDTDGDSFSDVDEYCYGTNSLNPLWYPMPNLNIFHFSSVVTYSSTYFTIDFSIHNNGIWKAEGIIVIIRCEELGLTLFNNTNLPFNLDVDDTVYINTNCLPIGQTGTYTLNITVNPNNLIPETYSVKNGSLRADWEANNSMIASLSIISTPSTPPPDSITYYITEDGDDDDDDDDDLISTSIITASIVIAVSSGVIATAIILHALLMKKRIGPDTPIPSKKKQPIE